LETFTRRSEDKGKAWLLSYLEGSERPYRALEDAFKRETKLSKRTLDRIKAELGIESRWQGRTMYWELPRGADGTVGAVVENNANDATHAKDAKSAAVDRALATSDVARPQECHDGSGDAAGHQIGVRRCLSLVPKRPDGTGAPRPGKRSRSMKPAVYSWSILLVSSLEEYRVIPPATHGSRQRDDVGWTGRQPAVRLPAHLTGKPSQTYVYDMETYLSTGASDAVCCAAGGNDMPV
jgi:hypothetical protein